MTTTSKHRTRSTSIKGTVATTSAALDFDSVLALDYAREWLSRAGLPRTSASAVMRRALALYMDHLNQETTTAQHEAKAVGQTVTRLAPEEEDRQGPATRLRGLQEGGPLLPFQDVLRGPDWASKHQAFNAEADRVADMCLASRPKQRHCG